VMSDPIEHMPDVVAHDMRAQAQNERGDEPSVYSCPECGGVLWQVADGDLIRFRCHVGHAYYGDNLLDEQAEKLEAALWTALRSFRERHTLCRQLAHKERQSGRPGIAVRLEDQAQLAQQHGNAIQRYLTNEIASPSNLSQENKGEAQSLSG